MFSNIMKRLNKPFEPITTLTIIYFALVAVSIALYALIQMYVDDEATASSLLGWSAAMFATIALLYTFNSWRNQKGSEVIAIECKDVFKDIIESSRNLININGYLSLNPSKDMKIKIENEIILFETAHSNIYRISLFLDAIIIEENLGNRIEDYYKKYLKIKTLLSFEMKMYGTNGISNRKELIDEYLLSTKKLTDILKPYVLYQISPRFKNPNKSA